jgi:signal transduction histidine kinase
MPRTSRDNVAEEVRLDVELGDDDHARLADLHTKLAPQLVEIAQRFVDRLAARRDAAGLTSTKRIRSLRHTLVEWMASGLAGPHDDDFWERRSSLGSWHAAAGLSQRHAIAAINAVRSEYHDQIDQLYEPREGRLVAKSVDKLLDVELASMVHDHLDPNAEMVARDRSAQSERIAAMQTLSTGLAHEVRNPLNSATLQLELLERRLRRAAADPKLIEPVEQVSHEIERLTRLLNEFLAFAHPSQFVLADHDVSGILRDVVAAQQPFAATRNAALQLAGVDSLRARIDAEKVRQISQNLVRNALEAVAPGGHVVVTVAGADEHVHVIVEDDGPGIPAAVQRRIYEPFFTTKETGTGLGLSIVHGMVAAHGGNITFESSPQRTRFDVSLPRRPWLQRSIST